MADRQAFEVRVFDPQGPLEDGTLLVVDDRLGRISRFDMSGRVIEITSMVDVANLFFSGDGNRHILFVRRRLDGTIADTLAEGKQGGVATIPGIGESISLITNSMWSRAGAPQTYLTTPPRFTTTVCTPSSSVSMNAINPFGPKAASSAVVPAG